MCVFYDAIDDCNLVDMWFAGNPFTLQRGRTRERLYRGLVNSDGAHLFTNEVLRHL